MCEADLQRGGTGWSPIAPEAKLDYSTTHIPDHGQQNVLEGVTVVELSGADCCASAVCRVLSDMGARVLQFGLCETNSAASKAQLGYGMSVCLSVCLPVSLLAY